MAGAGEMTEKQQALERFWLFAEDWARDYAKANGEDYLAVLSRLASWHPYLQHKLKELSKVDLF